MNYETVPRDLKDFCKLKEQFLRIWEKFSQPPGIRPSFFAPEQGIRQKIARVADYMRDENPHCIFLTRHCNCRSQQWWPDDIENEEGVAFDEFIESNNLTQLIDQPIHIMNESRSCIDLIITDQPNFLVDYGAHPSLYKMCHHEITYGKINLSILPPLSIKEKFWSIKMPT